MTRAVPQTVLGRTCWIALPALVVALAASAARGARTGSGAGEDAPATSTTLASSLARAPESVAAPGGASERAAERTPAPASAPTRAAAPASAPSPAAAPASSPAPAADPAPAPASAPSTPTGTHAHHSFSDTERYVKMFEDPARAEWQKPEKVVAALKLAPGQVVADIGAGSGYFTLPLAKAVGDKGRVYAVDIEPGMVDYIAKRATKEGVNNVVTVLAGRDDAKLPPASVDLAFICDTWHHIDARVAYLHRLSASLTPGARIAIVDYQKRPLPVGPTLESKIDRDDVVAEFRQAGFALVEEHTFLPYQYFLLFALPRAGR